jgi:hypothetical protein
VNAPFDIDLFKEPLVEYCRAPLSSSNNRANYASSTIRSGQVSR